MNQWHTFLASQGAIVLENAVSAYGNKQDELMAAASGSVMADLSHLSLLQVEGEDAGTFLQGQVTNDVKQLDGSNSQFAGYCNPKGRLLALFFAYAHQGKYYLQVNAELAEAITKRLRMYVLRSKVVVTDVSDQFVRIGVAGKNAGQALENIFPQLPQEALQMAGTEHGVVIRLPGSSPRYEVIVDADDAQTLWGELKQQLKPVGRDAWEWLEVQAGIPDITSITQEEFVPQMVNLDALGGINYKKGCYTGQEIVARTHYLGKVKRRTQLAHISSENSPSAGDDVFVEGNAEAVGKIVRSAPSPAGGYDVLTEVRLESLTAGKLSWNNNPLVLSHLPYQLD